MPKTHLAHWSAGLAAGQLPETTGRSACNKRGVPVTTDLDTVDCSVCGRNIARLREVFGAAPQAPDLELLRAVQLRALQAVPGLPTRPPGPVRPPTARLEDQARAVRLAREADPSDVVNQERLVAACYALDHHELTDDGRPVLLLLCPNTGKALVLTDADLWTSKGGS